jgi:hypothetical protein
LVSSCTGWGDCFNSDSKALFDSLRNIETVAVRRNYRDLSGITIPSGVTLFFLGASLDSLDLLQEDLLKALEKAAENGGRLIISIVPLQEKPGAVESGKRGPGHVRQERVSRESGEDESPHEPGRAEDQASPSGDSGDPGKGPARNDAGGTRYRSVSLFEQWGLGFGFEEPLDVSNRGDRAYRGVTDGLPGSISCHTVLYFEDLDESWQVVYTRKGQPVIIERDLGSGSLVLSADSFLFSNEALRVERYPKLLAWFVGANTTVIFDETHLGTRENPGIASLARKYRLHGLLLGIMVLAGLFVWKNTSHFVPPYDDPPVGSQNGPSSDKDSTAGFTSLLKRNISPSEILRVCITEWKRSLPARTDRFEDRLERIQGITSRQVKGSGEKQSLVKGYRSIQHILSERK